jgi:hypothetical protein
MPSFRRDRSPGDRRRKWAKPGVFKKTLGDPRTKGVPRVLAS